MASSNLDIQVNKHKYLLSLESSRLSPAVYKI